MGNALGDEAMDFGSWLGLCTSTQFYLNWVDTLPARTQPRKNIQREVDGASGYLVYQVPTRQEGWLCLTYNISTVNNQRSAQLDDPDESAHPGSAAGWPVEATVLMATAVQDTAGGQ